MRRTTKIEGLPGGISIEWDERPAVEVLWEGDGYAYTANELTELINALTEARDALGSAAAAGNAPAEDDATVLTDCAGDTWYKHSNGLWGMCREVDMWPGRRATRSRADIEETYGPVTIKQ